MTYSSHGSGGGSSRDGVVTGTDGNDVITPGFTDSDGDKVDGNDAILPGEFGDDDIIIAGEGDDTIDAGNGNDEVYAGSGDDEVDGGDGDDVIYGDSAPTGDFAYEREKFQWDKAPGFGDERDASGFTQDTGNVTVEFSIVDTYKTPDIEYETATNKTHSIDTGNLGYVDANSGLALETDSDNESATVALEFSDEVKDVSFRVNDIDYDSVVSIKAYDADGNPIEVDITGGSGLTLSDEDGVAGNETAASNGGGADATSGYYSILVNIPGPVSKIEIEHSNDGGDSSHVQITDVYFDAPIVVDNGAPGNDTLIAGDGHDLVYGEGGNDTIYGGGDNDVLDGGDDADTIIIDTLGSNGVNNTTVHGGSGGDDNDTLDFSALIDDGWEITHFVKNPENNGNPGYNGQVELYNSDTGETANINFTDIENIVPCFTPGTLVATPRGERLVEDLREGDKIITRDNGIQEIRWRGERRLTGRELAVARHLRPVLIRAGSLGNGLPERDMVVSPNHRMLVANDRTALYFEDREVLVAAKHLVNNRGVQVLDTIGTTYVHFLFDKHEVVLANGAWTESFQPGDYTLDGMGNAQRSEIFELFPELETREGRENYVAARKILKKHEAALLAE